MENSTCTMEKYRATANLPYDKIREEIDSQIKSTPEVRDIRFIKLDGKKRYDGYALKGTDIPAFDSSDFIGAAPTKKLADIVNGKLKEDSLPKEIRVIHQDHEKDSWDIFFKQ